MMKQLGALTTILLLVSLVFVGQVAAERTTFKQKILPLNCVFQEVNDGLGTLIYLTPKECGQIITPPSTGNNGGPSSTPSGSGTPTGSQTYDPAGQQAPSPGTTLNSPGISTPEPITRINDKQPLSRDSQSYKANTWALTAAIVSAAVLTGFVYAVNIRLPFPRKDK